MSTPSLYFLNRKSDSRSPRFEQIHEFISKEGKNTKGFKNILSRNKSAKVLENKLISKKRNDTPSSNRNTLAVLPSPRSTWKLQQDSYFLSKLKPKFILSDKEQLYQDNLSLKIALNSLQAEHVKIKTRLSHLEKELSKKEDIIEELSSNEKFTGHKYIHLINGLKQALKEAKNDVSSKDEEIVKLKKNIRITKIAELEAQVQKYEEECKRLSVFLEEALAKKRSFKAVTENEKNLESELIISLKKENEKLKETLSKAEDENDKLRLVHDPEKKVKNSPQQVTSLKLKVQKLKTQIETMKKDYKDKENKLTADLANDRKKIDELKTKLENEENRGKELQRNIQKLKNQTKILPKFKSPANLTPRKSPRSQTVIKDLKQLLRKQKISPRGLITVLDKDHNGFADQEDFIKFFKSLGKTLKKSDLDELTEKKSGKLVINLAALQKNLEKRRKSGSSTGSENQFNFPTSPVVFTESSPVENPGRDLENILKHISLSMQLNRLEKDQVFEIFFSELEPDSKISRSELANLLKHPPFGLPRSLNTDKLCDFLISVSQQNKSLRVSKVVASLNKYLPDWTIFDSDEEEIYDYEITQFVVKNKKKLLEKCQAFDIKHNGSILLEEFRLVIDEYKGAVSERMFQYMTLLFYSHKNELNEVPYMHFIKAYGDQADEESPYSERDKVEIVNRYLIDIVIALKKQKKNLKEIFQIENGLIYPESFISGLESLGFKNIEHDCLAFILEALQYSKGNEVCVSVEEFENLVESLAEKIKEAFKNEENLKEKEGKSTSNCESGYFEYSDDTPGRRKLSEISPFASVSNPHQAKQSSLSGNKISPKRNYVEATDRSSKITLIISKIENQTYKKKDSLSESIKDILHHAKDYEASSHSSRLRNSIDAKKVKNVSDIPSNLMSSKEISNPYPAVKKTGNNEAKDDKYSGEENDEIFDLSEDSSPLKRHISDVKLPDPKEQIKVEESFGVEVYNKEYNLTLGMKESNQDNELLENIKDSPYEKQNERSEYEVKSFGKEEALNTKSVFHGDLPEPSSKSEYLSDHTAKFDNKEISDQNNNPSFSQQGIKDLNNAKFAQSKPDIPKAPIYNKSKTSEKSKEDNKKTIDYTSRSIAINIDDFLESESETSEKNYSFEVFEDQENSISVDPEKPGKNTDLKELEKQDSPKIENKEQSSEDISESENSLDKCFIENSSSISEKPIRSDSRNKKENIIDLEELEESYVKGVKNSLGKIKSTESYSNNYSEESFEEGPVEKYKNFEKKGNKEEMSNSDEEVNFDYDKMIAKKFTDSLEQSMGRF